MDKPQIVILRLRREPEQEVPEEANPLDILNDLLAAAAMGGAPEQKETQSEFEREDDLDMVPINVPTPSGTEIVTRFVHPDVKALIDELLHTITTQKHNFIYLQQEINSLVEGQ